MKENSLTLIFDIGNTNVKTAVYDNQMEKFIQLWRLPSDKKTSGEEYFSILNPLFSKAGIEFSEIKKTVLSSVVPALIEPFVTVTKLITRKEPLIISSELFDRLPVKVPETAVHEIGTDLYCDAFGAWSEFHSPCIVADFGTALSFTVINKDGNIEGVAIAPGIRTAFNALFNKTAQIPEIPLEVPPTSLGKNTVVAVQSGIVLGYKGLAEGMIKQLKADLEKETGTKPEDVKVIATGGLSSVLQSFNGIFDCCDKELTLKGLAAISRLVD